MTDAHRRRFDAILVWKIDSFGRSLKHLVNALADLSAYGVAFVSLRDNLDLSTPSGRLMFQIIGAMAEFERALIQERVEAGLRNAEAKGKRLGRPRRFVDASRIAALRASGYRGARFRERWGLGSPLCTEQPQRNTGWHQCPPATPPARERWLGYNSFVESCSIMALRSRIFNKWSAHEHCRSTKAYRRTRCQAG